MDNLIKRLKEIRKKSGLSQKEMAKKLDIPYGTFRRYESGLSATPINILCKYEQLGFNIMWILRGEGSPNYTDRFSLPEETGKIPVMGIADTGPGIFSEDGDFPPGGSDLYVSRPHGLRDPNAFGIKIEGDSMLPALKPSQIAIVSPNLECRNGDLVAVNLKSGGKVLAELKLKADQIHLIQYNDEDLIVKKSDLFWCYPVMWIKTRL